MTFVCLRSYTYDCLSVGAEQLGKLKSELDIVQQNTRVFSEMLTELTPGEESPSDLELLTVSHFLVTVTPWLQSRPGYSHFLVTVTSW